MKRTSILKLDADSLAALGPAAMTLARAEGLEAHRRSVAIRLNPRDEPWRAGAADRDPARLVSVTLDQASLGRNNAEVEHEREVAIFDLLEENSFALEGHERRPLHAAISRSPRTGSCSPSATRKAQPITHVMLSLSPFRRIVKDYFMHLRKLLRGDQDRAASKIEAIDMGRRGLHDEGSRSCSSG